MRPHTPVVIGYHGCSRELAELLVSGKEKLVAQNRSYHWLGDGIYFWENDQDRAFEWAEEKASRGEVKNPCVIGAVIDPGDCLDLSVRENVPLVKRAYDDLMIVIEKLGHPKPVNKPAPKDTRDDKVMRHLDCAVINHLVKTYTSPVDTVRGLFTEGGPIYEGAEIRDKTHIEIAVRNPACIKGVFLPL